MRLEPRRSGWPLAQHTACCSSLRVVPLRPLCSLEMKWDGKKTVLFLSSTPATVATWHVVLWSSCPLLPVSAHHVQASGLHGQNVAGACVMPAHIVYAFAVSTFLFHHFRGCAAPVGACFFFFVWWAQRCRKGLLYSGRNMCACRVVMLSECLLQLTQRHSCHCSSSLT